MALELLVADQQGEIAGLGEVDLGGQEGGGLEGLVAALFGQIGERWRTAGCRRRSNRRRCIASCAGLVLHRFGRRQNAILHVVGERLGRRGVRPG